jgi:hypothetical protein
MIQKCSSKKAAQLRFQVATIRAHYALGQQHVGIRPTL